MITTLEIKCLCEWLREEIIYIINTYDESNVSIKVNECINDLKIEYQDPQLLEIVFNYNHNLIKKVDINFKKVFTI